MLKIIITLLFAIAFSNFVSKSSQANSSFDGLSRAEFLDAYEDKMEDAWESYSLLYSRMNPDLADLVPGKEWTDEDRVISACIYDKMDEIGKMDEYIVMIDNMDTITDLIKSNEKITVFNVAEFDEIESVTDIEGYTQAMSSCGQIELMSKRMKESGLWEKMMATGAAQAQENN